VIVEIDFVEYKGGHAYGSARIKCCLADAPVRSSTAENEWMEEKKLSKFLLLWYLSGG